MIFLSLAFIFILSINGVHQFEYVAYHQKLKYPQTKNISKTLNLFFSAYNRIFELFLEQDHHEMAPNLEILSMISNSNFTYHKNFKKYLDSFYSGYVKDDKYSKVEGNIIDGVFAGRILLSSFESLPYIKPKLNFIPSANVSNFPKFDINLIPKINNTDISYGASFVKDEYQDFNQHKYLTEIDLYVGPKVLYIERTLNLRDSKIDNLSAFTHEPLHHSIIYFEDHTKDFMFNRPNSIKDSIQQNNVISQPSNILSDHDIAMNLKSNHQIPNKNDGEFYDSWCGLSNNHIRDWMSSHFHNTPNEDKKEASKDSHLSTLGSQNPNFSQRQHNYSNHFSPNNNHDTNPYQIRHLRRKRNKKLPRSSHQGDNHNPYRSRLKRSPLKTPSNDYEKQNNQMWNIANFKSSPDRLNKSPKRPRHLTHTTTTMPHSQRIESVKFSYKPPFPLPNNHVLRQRRPPVLPTPTSSQNSRIQPSRLLLFSESSTVKSFVNGVDKSGMKPTSQNDDLTSTKFNQGGNGGRRPKIPDKNTCSLFIQTDTFLWNHVAKRLNTKDKRRIREEIISMISSHIKAVNHIYGSTTFGNYVGIQFVVQRIKILEDTYCHKVVDQKQSQYCNPNLDVSNVLNLWSLENHDDFCLAYLWTYRDFVGGTLGLAWVAAPDRESGGICENFKLYPKTESNQIPTYKSLNTGIITFVNYGVPVSPRVTHLTKAHEIGHNFGSPHDFPGSCRPGQAMADRRGNFIMFSSATSGDKHNNDKFSSCSKQNISSVLESIVNEKQGKANCFIKNDGAFCGNGLREEGEECDCGYPEDCQENGEIACCYPRTDDPNTSCKRREGVKCSPSEGPCCTKQCKHVTPDILCVSATECSYDSFCTGISSECPEPRYKTNQTTACNDNTQVCWNGQCLGSICEKLNLEQCFITAPRAAKEYDRGKLCQLACQITDQPETCKSSYEYPALRSINNGSGINLKPGSPCNNYQGYCDVFLKCREVSEGPLTRLKNLIFNTRTFEVLKKWIVDNWWIVSLAGLFLLMFMGIFIKFCAVHTPSSNPRKPPARSFSDTMSRTANTIRRTSHHVMQSASTLRRISSHPLHHTSSTEMPISRIRVIGSENRLKMKPYHNGASGPAHKAINRRVAKSATNIAAANADNKSHSSKNSRHHISNHYHQEDQTPSNHHSQHNAINHISSSNNHYLPSNDHRKRQIKHPEHHKYHPKQQSNPSSSSSNNQNLRKTKTTHARSSSKEGRFILQNGNIKDNIRRSKSSSRSKSTNGQKEYHKKQGNNNQIKPTDVINSTPISRDLTQTSSKSSKHLPKTQNGHLPTKTRFAFFKSPSRKNTKSSLPNGTQSIDHNNNPNQNVTSIKNHRALDSSQERINNDNNITKETKIKPLINNSNLNNGHPIPPPIETIPSLLLLPPSYDNAIRMTTTSHQSSSESPVKSLPSYSPSAPPLEESTPSHKSDNAKHCQQQAAAAAYDQNTETQLVALPEFSKIPKGGYGKNRGFYYHNSKLNQIHAQKSSSSTSHFKHKKPNKKDKTKEK